MSETIGSITKVYQAMTQEDKAALQALKAEEEKRTGKTLQLRDIIMATTPGLEDPAYLTGSASPT